MPPSSPAAVDALAAVSTLRPFEEGAAHLAARLTLESILRKPIVNHFHRNTLSGFFFL